MDATAPSFRDAADHAGLGAPMRSRATLRVVPRSPLDEAEGVFAAAQRREQSRRLADCAPIRGIVIAAPVAVVSWAVLLTPLAIAAHMLGWLPL